MTVVGIDDLAIYIPKLYLDYKDFAERRGIEPQKLEYGIGIKKMAITDTNQDSACMASNACLKLMQRNHLHPQDIGRVYVDTESSLDESKAMNSFVVGMLEQIYGEGSFEHAGGIECKFACVSGSYALYDNANWIRAEENNGKAAVVIVSDIAKYDMGSTGEYTQGAGAVALLVKEKPRLMAFYLVVARTSIKNDYQFYRQVIKEIGTTDQQPKDARGTIESILADTQFMKADEQFRRSFMQTSFYDEVYEKKMATSLEASAIIGNLYTASMYMGLRSLLEFEF